MKKVLLLIPALFICFHQLHAQSFGVEYTSPDTVYFTSNGNGNVNVEDSIYVPSGTLSLKWNVISTNFPTDWVQGTAFCDNILCHGLPTLWPSGSMQTSGEYTPGNGAFLMVIDFSAVTSCGTYYVALKMYNAAVPTDTANEVYVIGYCPTSVASVNNSNEVILYPNPAGNAVNVVYSPDADIKAVAIYNMIGKMVVVNKASSSSATINIENLPSGVYFMRLVNGSEETVAIRKFIKE